MPPNMSGGVKEPCREAKHSWAPLKAARVETRRLRWQKRQLCTFEKGWGWLCFLCDVHVGECDFFVFIMFCNGLDDLFQKCHILCTFAPKGTYNLSVWTSYKASFFFSTRATAKPPLLPLGDFLVVLFLSVNTCTFYKTENKMHCFCSCKFFHEYHTKEDFKEAYC